MEVPKMPKKFAPCFALLASMGALCLALAIAPAALAARGGGGDSGGSSSLSLVMVNDLNGNGLPNWGDSVTFAVSTTAYKPTVLLECFQNGVVVDRQQAGFFPGYMFSKEYELKSSRWTGGAADCTATLFETTKNGSRRTFAMLSFHVEA
jgi:hypothetical protein